MNNVVFAEAQILDINGNGITSEQAGASQRALHVAVKNDKATYIAGFTSVASAANATDLITIVGSATKIIRIKRVVISAIATDDSNAVIQLVKRSTNNTGGTSTSLNRVPLDSQNAAATATVRAYTANPTLGTLVGLLASSRLQIGVLAPANNSNTPSNPNELFRSNGRGQDIVLRGTSEIASINLNAVTIAGGLFSGCIEWVEE